MFDLINKNLSIKIFKGRHQSDKIVNNRETQVIINNDLINQKWKDIQVGDIVQLLNDQFVTV